jgi:hypothetical protein
VSQPSQNSSNAILGVPPFLSTGKTTTRVHAGRRDCLSSINKIVGL